MARQKPIIDVMVTGLKIPSCRWVGKPQNGTALLEGNPIWAQQISFC
jgi:hypothetical protein